LKFSDGEMPFTKPRFIIQSGELQIINRPFLSARKMFSAGAIGELPFINYDRYNAPTEWDQPQWELLHHSYMFRLLTSLHPLYKLDRPETSFFETERINRTLFLKFRQAVLDDGGRPLIVHLRRRGT